jgi:malate dehydrogenase (oxaloacetate-decarboxylating)(NADP+)
MKMACALALAHLAREPVPQSVKDIYPNRELVLGTEYIIPTPFDPRLITVLPAAVAKAAMESGVAKVPITDMEAYKKLCAARCG